MDDDAQREELGSALQLTALHGHTEMVEQLIEAGADVNARNWSGTELDQAAEGGHNEVVKQLLEVAGWSRSWRIGMKKKGNDKNLCIAFDNLRPVKSKSSHWVFQLRT